MTQVLTVTNESNEVCTDVLFDNFLLFRPNAKYAKTNLTNKGQNMFSVTSSSSLASGFGLGGRRTTWGRTKFSTKNVDLSDLTVGF